ncbi:MAG: hypothetical protein LUB61_06055 [Eggerthellaceae bacterium]|nr:hypothetical protein [Eggerthellaceae bacterium]
MDDNTVNNTANAVSDDITNGIRDIFLAGVGAMAIGAEKSKELVNNLVKQGQITVDQGKKLQQDLGNKAYTATADMRDKFIAEQMKHMSKDERDEFAARVAEMAAAADAEAAEWKSEQDEIEAIENDDAIADAQDAIDSVDAPDTL